MKYWRYVMKYKKLDCLEMLLKKDSIPDQECLTVSVVQLFDNDELLNLTRKGLSTKVYLHVEEAKKLDKLCVGK